MMSLRKITLALSLIIVSSVQGHTTTEPLGGQPPKGAKPSVRDLEFQVKYQRAFEAVLWSMPAVAIYRFYKAAKLVGGTNNTILAWSTPAKANAELLTANNVTPYLLSQTDLSKGPVIIEIPAATQKVSFYGQIVDHWQITIADVGPFGIDKGKGGKVLLTPPGYNKPIPKGYIEIKSPSYRVAMAFRSIKSSIATLKDAYAYSKTLKMYYLNDPKPTQFIDPSDMRFPSLVRYDETWFQDLYEIFNLENAKPRDKVMMGMLASLGIEKGKPYHPDAKTLKAMKQGVTDAYFYMQERMVHPKDPKRLWWKDRHWYDGVFCDDQRMFKWETSDLIDLDNRADRYHIGTYYPNKLPKLPQTQYLFPLADADGNELLPNKTYSFTMPAKVPATQFWSLLINDQRTGSFIYTKEGVIGFSSFDLKKGLKANKDGSVTIYFGTKCPKGKESNWIPTAGHKPLPILRIYGGTEEFWDRSWKMPDVELVK